MKSVFGGSANAEEASRSVSDLSDESLKKLMKMTGQEPTPEAIVKFRKSIEASAKMAGQIRGSITQTFQRVVLDELMEKEDFDYQIPKNAGN